MRTLDLITLTAVLATLLLCLSCGGVRGQTGVDDTGGTEDTGKDDMLPDDPNILGPTNKHGYGRDVPTQLHHNNNNKNSKDGKGGKGKGGGAGSDKKAENPHGTMAEQTVQAALQFGVLVSWLVDGAHPPLPRSSTVTLPPEAARYCLIKLLLLKIGSMCSLKLSG